MAFTRHGHHISGTTFDVSKRPKQIARCGGPGLCDQCSVESVQYQIETIQPSSKENDKMDDLQLQAMLIVMRYYNERIGHVPDVHDEVSIDDIYVVWFSKTLQNWKALVSTKNNDGLYFELTHNGDKNETYIDAYRKIENYVVAG